MQKLCHTTALRQCWHDLMQSVTHPSVESLTRLVLVTHIVYYAVATIGISYTAIHTITSGACLGVLCLELFLKGRMK